MINYPQNSWWPRILVGKVVPLTIVLHTNYIVVAKLQSAKKCNYNYLGKLQCLEKVTILCFLNFFFNKGSLNTIYCTIFFPILALPLCILVKPIHKKYFSEKSMYYALSISFTFYISWCVRRQF